jgi:autotransporter translocation and assembly factor TamB
VNRKQRILAYVALGVITGFIIAGLALYAISRSEFGMERVRRFAISWLDERVDGTVHVGELGGRGLLGGLTLRDFSIIDQRGRPFLHADSARIAYNWRTLLAGEIVITRATLFEPEVYFEQLPGDSIWNYQHVFPKRGPPGVPGRKRLIMINELRIVNGTGVVRVPYETREDVRAAIEDPRREVIDTVPGGLAKVLRFDSIYSDLSRVLWESPIEPGKLIDIRSLRGRGFVWHDPMHVTALRGTLTLQDTVIAFDMPDARFPASRASIVGRVIMEKGQNVFDVRADSRSFAFRDLKWLHPKLPDNGGGSGILRIQSQRPRGILWLATDMRIAAPSTRVAGSFGVVTGADSLYFTNVDLRASPLNLDLVQEILPNRLPVDGLLVGTVEVKGGLSALETRGDVQFASDFGNSGVKWRGTIDVRRGLGANNFRADMQKLDLAMLSALRPDLNLRGQVTGHFEANGNTDRSVRFAADIHHFLSGYSSNFAGGGTYTGGLAPGLDIEMNATPLSLEDLAQYYPALARLRGEARGPIRISGTLDSLNVNADLETAGGRALVEGRLTRTGMQPRYAGAATLFSFRLDRLVADLVETELAGKIRFDLSGSGSHDVAGRISTDLTQGKVGAIEFRDAHAVLSVEPGIARIDTFAARTFLGAVTAGGTFGLTPDRTGKLAFEIQSDSLAPLTTDSTRPATTSGRLRGTGELAGSIQSFDLNANVAVTGLRYGAVTGDQLVVGMTGAGLGGEDARIEVRGRADSLVAFNERADTANFTLSYANGRGAARIDAGSKQGDTWIADGDFERRDQGLLIALRDLRAGHQQLTWNLTNPAIVAVDDHGLTTDSLELSREGSGRVRAAGRVAWHDASHTPEAAQTSDFRLDFAGVPFAELALVSGGPHDVKGSLEGHVRVTGSAVEPVLDGEVAVSGFGVGGASLDRLGGSFTYAGKRINARIDGDKDGRRVFFADGRIPIDLAFAPVAERRLAEPLRFSMQADSMPLSFLTAMVGGFDDVHGRVDGTLLASGTTLHPQLGGSLVLKAGGALWSATGVQYSDVNGDIRLGAESLAHVDASVTANGGGARITGTIDLKRVEDPGFDLQLDADNFLAAKRRDVEVTASGNLQLRGRYRRPELTGAVAIERSALFLDELYRRYQIVELDNPLLYDVVDTSLVAIGAILHTQNPFVKNLIVRDLRVNVGREVSLRSRDLNVEVAGDVTVAFLLSDTLAGSRGADDVRLLGSLRAIRGTYQLFYPGIVRQFSIREGTVDFPGTPGVDPNLGINAIYRAPRSAGRDPIDIIAVVGGTMRTPRVRLTSDEEPPISESDLASYLFFGVPTYELTANQNAAVSQATSGLVGGYVASGLQTFAQNFGLLDFVSLTAAEAVPGVPTQTGIASLFADTRLELGRYVGKDAQVYIAYSQRFTSSGYLNPGVRIEWRFLPTLTAELFAEDRFARGAPSFGIENNAVPKKVYGFLLFREWSY